MSDCKRCAELEAALRAAQENRAELIMDIENLFLVATTDEDADGFVSAYHFKTGALHHLLAKARTPLSAPAQPATEIIDDHDIELARAAVAEPGNTPWETFKNERGLTLAHGIGGCVMEVGHDGSCEETMSKAHPECIGRTTCRYANYSEDPEQTSVTDCNAALSAAVISSNRPKEPK